MKKMDYIFAGIIVVLSGLLWVLSYCRMQGSQVEVISQNEVVGTYDLFSNQDFVIYDDDGHWNHVQIIEGIVTILDADCPDRLCVKQKAISKDGEAIICLPHKLSVRITGAAFDGVDAIAN